MGLTESKKKDLEDKAFDELFRNQKAKWKGLATKAHKFAKDNITDGNEPRPDDIAKALRPMIEVDESFRGHQEDNGARSPRFVDWFTEYVIDQILINPGEQQ